MQDPLDTCKMYKPFAHVVRRTIFLSEVETVDNDPILITYMGQIRQPSTKMLLLLLKIEILELLVGVLYC